MQNKPTAKKRRPVDDWYWKLVLEACGNKCCSCGKHQSDLESPLERGHIKLHVGGGDASPENIIPVCRPCNKQHAKSDTPSNYLPEDYRSRIAVLVCLRLDAKISCLHDAPSRRVILTNKPTENTSVIDWQTGDFGFRTEVYTCSRSMMPAEAFGVVDKLIEESEKCDPAPNIPNRARRLAMKDLVERYREERFMAAGRSYLRQKRWVTPDDHFLADSWGQFVDGFEHFDRRARTEEKEQAARAKREEETRLSLEGEERAQRWTQYLRAAEVPEWPDMTDADREIIATAKSFSGEAMRDVTGADLKLTRDISLRLAQYREKKLMEAKGDLKQRGELSMKILRLLDEPDEEFGKRIKTLCENIASLKTLDIEKLTTAWDILEQDLTDALDRQELARSGVGDAVNDPNMDNF